MSSTQTLTVSFLSELMQALHNFKASGGNTFNIALYTSAATMNTSTTVYSATNEVTSANYVAGGLALTNVNPTTSGTTAYTSFANAVWNNVTFTARYALIYNATNSNRAVAVLDFGTNKVATNQTFTVVMPPAAAATAIIQITEN